MNIEFTVEQAQAVTALINGQIQQHKGALDALNDAYNAIVRVSKEGPAHGKKETDY